LEQARNYLKILRETTPKKPVIVWQGGITSVGKRSILSHTGSISGKNEVIKAAFKQNGAILIEYGGRNLLYTALLISYLMDTGKFMKLGKNLGSILGGGGNNVYFADTCTSKGLNLPNIDPKTLEKLKNVIGEIGTLLKNPIDLNVKMFDMKSVIQVMKILDKLDYIDILTFEPGIDWEIMNANLMKKLNPDLNFDLSEMIESNMKTIIRTIRKLSKPLIIISAQTFCDADIIAERNKIEDMFRRYKIPVFPDIETMSEAIIKAIEYKKFLEKIKLK